MTTEGAICWYITGASALSCLPMFSSRRHVPGPCMCKRGRQALSSDPDRKSAGPGTSQKGARGPWLSFFKALIVKNRVLGQLYYSYNKEPPKIADLPGSRPKPWGCLRPKARWGFGQTPPSEPSLRRPAFSALQPSRLVVGVAVVVAVVVVVVVEEEVPPVSSIYAIIICMQIRLRRYEQEVYVAVK